VVLVVFLVGIPTLLVAVQKLNLPAAAAVLAVKPALETVFRVGQAAAVDLPVVDQLAAGLHHHLVKETPAAVLCLALFLAVVVALTPLARQERSPLLVAVEMATLIR
jgi:hypothetical protein